MEPKTNVVTICKGHYQPGSFRYPAKWFVGKIVKIGFRDLNGSTEWMWVKVLSGYRGRCTGRLDNKPTYATYLRLHDEVTFMPRDVVAVWNPSDG